MSERLRWVVNKPISRTTLREKIELCLRTSGKLRVIYQFNLPGEEAADFDEFEHDVEHMRATFSKGALATTFIPNQPSAHTPFQWVVPRYSLDMHARLLAFRERFIGSVKTGLGVYLPTPLGPRAWFSQVIAEWIPVTPAVAAAVEKLPAKAELPEMVQALNAQGVALPREFLHRDADTVFPWSNIVTTGDDANKWKRYEGMRRKLASPRFAAVSEDMPEAWER